MSEYMFEVYIESESENNEHAELKRLIGEACKGIMDSKMRNIPAKQIEVDEIWGFIGAKRKNAARVGAYGDVWTFIALDADRRFEAQRCRESL